MPSKSTTNKHPWWAKLLLLILFILDMLIAEMLRNNSFLTPIKGIEIYAAYIIFGQISGIIVGLIIFLFYRAGQSYKNKGDAVDRSHIWVNARSGKKVSDATVKNVYEKLHGYGSWEKKVKKERGCATVFMVIAAVALSIYGFYALSFRARLPLLAAVQNLIGSSLLYWLSWLGLMLVGAGTLAAIFFLTFYDLTNYNATFITSPTGKPLGLENDPPALWSILPKGIALILAILLNIAVLVYTLFPSLRSAPVGRHYQTVVLLTFFVSGIMWLFGIFLQDIQLSQAAQQKQDLQNKKKAIEDSLQKFFGRDTDPKERLISGLVLLAYRDNLTYDGKKSLVEGLKVITGQDFGTDYKKWEDWLMNQLMNK